MKKLLLSFLLVVPIIVFCQIINVPDDYGTIQEGIDAANLGDTVLVQTGIYYENIIWSNKDIILTSNYLFSQDTNDILQTIIDGDTTGCVLALSDLSQEALLNGFTIQNGYAPDQFGGGLQINFATPMLTNLIIKDNTAMRGGGINIENSALFLLNSSVINNVGIERAGGVKTRNCNVVIEDCTISDNQSEFGAGAYMDIIVDFDEVYSIELTSNIISNNVSLYQGGGIYIRREGVKSIVDVAVRNCDFLNNSAGANGGMILRGDSMNFNIENCKFMNNSVDQYNAGLTLMNACSGMVFNSLFANNIANTGGENWNGGGATTWASGEVSFWNCTFAENQAAYGAGLTVGPLSLAYTTNCIFRGNFNQQVAVTDYDVMGGTLYMDYCNIQYGIDSIQVDPNSNLMWGDHNSTGDPLFVASGDEPYAISIGSPCVDGGVPDPGGIEMLPYDILGNVRIWDGDGNSSVIIDMGAYEFGAPVWVGIPDNPYVPTTENIIEKVYPNPCSETIWVQYNLSGNESVYCDIYSISGKKVFQKEIRTMSENELEIDISHLSPGIYFIQLQSKNHIGNAKIIVM
jgi:hypothetical protein